MYVYDVYGNTKNCVYLSAPNFLGTKEGTAFYLRRTAGVERGTVNEHGKKKATYEGYLSFIFLGLIPAIPHYELNQLPSSNIFAKENFSVTIMLQQEHERVLHKYRNHNLYAWYNVDKVSLKVKT